MPGAERTHGPPAAKNAGGSHHRYAERAGIPCATALRLIRVLPGVPGFLAPVARNHPCELGASVGASGPHDFTVRIGALVSCAGTSTASRTTFRDDSAYVPLSARDGRNIAPIALLIKRIIFDRRAGLVGQITCRGHRPANDEERPQAG